MGASTSDLFGAAAGAEPATPGSYGEAPRGHRLPDATRPGPVRLQIADLARFALAYRELPMGHCVTPESLAVVTAWLAASLDGVALAGAEGVA